MPGRNEKPSDLNVVDGGAERAESDRRMAHVLLNGIACQFGMIGEQCPLVGVIAQYLHRGGQLVASGIGASHQKARDEHAQLVSAETITVVFSADQVREQVVGQ